MVAAARAEKVQAVKDCKAAETKVAALETAISKAAMAVEAAEATVADLRQRLPSLQAAAKV